jgi:hypothetical protein
MSAPGHFNSLLLSFIFYQTKMSKLKVRNSVFGLVALSLIGVGILSPIQATTNFQDVPSTHIYSEQIRYMKEKGISYGFNNGTEYRPESPITRKEIITLLIKAKYPMEEINNCIQANGYTGKNIFNDVPSTHHFAPAICMAKVKTIAVGYSNGNFGPDDATTAHAGIKVIMRTLAEDLPIDINAPLEEYTQYLWGRGFYPPTINRANESTMNMNRGEVAHVVFRFSGYQMFIDQNLGVKFRIPKKINGYEYSKKAEDGCGYSVAYDMDWDHDYNADRLTLNVIWNVFPEDSDCYSKVAISAYDLTSKDNDVHKFIEGEKYSSSYSFTNSTLGGRSALFGKRKLVSQQPGDIYLVQGDYVYEIWFATAPIEGLDCDGQQCRDEINKFNQTQKPVIDEIVRSITFM